MFASRSLDDCKPLHLMQLRGFGYRRGTMLEGKLTDASKDTRYRDLL